MSTQPIPTQSLNFQDRRLLQSRRVQRMQAQLIYPLGLCRLAIDKRNCLVIHCPEAWIVDYLLEDLDMLLEDARVIAGSGAVSLYFIGEEVFSARTDATCLVAS